MPIHGFIECPLVKREMSMPYADFLLSLHEAGRCRKCGKEIRLIPNGALIDFGIEISCTVFMYVERDRVEVPGVKVVHSIDTSGLDRQYFIG